MKIQERLSEVKRFLRSTKDAFEKLVEGQAGGEYVVSFGFALQTTPVSDSEVKSLVSAIEKSVSAFADDGKVTVNLDIIHKNGFDGKLLDEVRSNYETSKKLEEAAATPIAG